MNIWIPAIITKCDDDGEPTYDLIVINPEKYGVVAMALEVPTKKVEFLNEIGKYILQLNTSQNTCAFLWSIFRRCSFFGLINFLVFY